MSVGDRFQYNGINYSLISKTTIQVGFGLGVSPYTSAVARSYTNDINIPSYITYNSKQYKVKRVGAHAFYCCSSIKTITIPPTITSFEWSCFNGMSSLANIIIHGENKMKFISCDILSSTAIKEFFIPSSVNSMDENALHNAKNIKISYCGKNKINNFKLDNTPALIYVSRDYPYSSFGGIPVEKSLYCEIHKCKTLNINKGKSLHASIILLSY